MPGLTLALLLQLELVVLLGLTPGGSMVRVLAPGHAVHAPFLPTEAVRPDPLPSCGVAG